MFPLIYGLLHNKQQNTYERFVNMIKSAITENGAMMIPDTVAVDFEVSAMQAVRKVMLQTSIKGCRFHFGQAINRCIQCIGLSSAYQNSTSNSDVRKWIKRTTSLPLMPTDRLDEVWIMIMNDATDIPEAILLQLHGWRT